VPRARAGGPPGSHLRLTIAGTSGISHALPSTASTVPAALVAATSHRGYAAGAQPPHQVGVSSGDRLHVCPVDVWETQQTGSAQQHTTQRLASSLTPSVHETCRCPGPVRPRALAARSDRRSTHDWEYPAGGEPSEARRACSQDEQARHGGARAGPLHGADECTNEPWVLHCAGSGPEGHHRDRGRLRTGPFEAVRQTRLGPCLGRRTGCRGAARSSWLDVEAGPPRTATSN
jgi:hypothetical protein